MAIVKLFYYGGLKASPNSPDGTIIVTSRQRAFAVPPIGEYIEIDELFASDLIRRHQVSDRVGTRYPVFGTDARYADAVKTSGGDPKQILIQSLKSMSEQERNDILAQAGLLTPETSQVRQVDNAVSSPSDDVDLIKTEDEPEDEIVSPADGDDEQPQRRAGRPPKKKEEE